jgi:Zn-dependent peptidase ImmA (M78 family)
MNLFGDDDWKRSGDPDVAALSHEEGGDPYAAVRRKAEALLAQLDDFASDSVTPLERIKSLASLAGFAVRPAADGMLGTKGRAAMFIPPKAIGGHGQIVYDARLSTGRMIYSIGHEIVHSFFPNSNAGVQFRSIHAGNSKPGRQLEMLCEYGASLLVMPEHEFVEAADRHGFGLAHVESIRLPFGTSFEATTYRLAEIAAFPAAAVKFKFRLAKKDFNTKPASGQLFPMPDLTRVQPKYRCQTSRRSPSFRGLIPYNKSVPETSAVYSAGANLGIHRAVETLTFSGRTAVRYRVEAMRAPFQPPDSDPNHPDVLALFWIV